MLKIAKPIVVVLLLQAAIELMTRQTYPDYKFIAVSVAAFAAVIILKVNPAVVMLGGVVFGFVFYKLFL